MQDKYSKDSHLERKILDIINWDARVSMSDLRLKVKNGIVSLFGYFDKPYRKEAALKVITSTQGVLAIRDNSCVLEDYHRTDAEIESILVRRILEFPFSHGEWIDVSVSQAVVRYEGVVHRARFKALCAKMAWELSGVKDCINFIEMSPVPKSTTLQAHRDHHALNRIAI